MNVKVLKHDPRERTSHTRVYFHHDETLLQNLRDRRSRPHRYYRTLLPQVFAEVLRQEGWTWDLGAVDVAWSQKAGCRCGCSPGFIVRGAYRSWDVHVSFPPAPTLERDLTKNF